MVIDIIQVIRRMVWGLLRLEHEQLEVLGYPEGSSEYSLSAASEIKSFDKVKSQYRPYIITFIFNAF
jgi:hypothetical protein